MPILNKNILDALVNEHPSLAKRITDIAGANYFGAKKVRQAIVTQTGIMSLDLALGGGLPAGLVELYGPPQVGKTGLLGQLIGFAQRTGLSTALVASEALDVPYLQSTGVDTSALPVIFGGDPDAEANMLDFVSTQRNSLLAVDSTTMLRLPDEEPTEWNARMEALFSRMVNLLSVDSCVVMTSQVRTHRFSDTQRDFFHGRIDSASRRIADYFNLRLELARDQVSLKEYTMLVRVVRNILSMPDRVIELPVIKGHGVRIGLDLVRVAVALGIVERRGPQYYIDDRYLGIGEKGAAETLEYDHDMQLEVIGKVVERTT